MALFLLVLNTFKLTIPFNNFWFSKFWRVHQFFSCTLYVRRRELGISKFGLEPSMVWSPLPLSWLLVYIFFNSSHPCFGLIFIIKSDNMKLVYFFELFCHSIEMLIKTLCFWLPLLPVPKASFPLHYWSLTCLLLWLSSNSSGLRGLRALHWTKIHY